MPNKESLKEITRQADFSFKIHDALEDYDSDLAQELDNEGYASNKKMRHVIACGLAVIRGEGIPLYED